MRKLLIGILILVAIWSVLTIIVSVADGAECMTLNKGSVELTWDRDSWWGHRIYYGDESNNYDHSVDIKDNESYVFNLNREGYFYINITGYDKVEYDPVKKSYYGGAESAFSTEICIYVKGE